MEHPLPPLTITPNRIQRVDLHELNDRPQLHRATRPNGDSILTTGIGHTADREPASPAGPMTPPAGWTANPISELVFQQDIAINRRAC